VKRKPDNVSPKTTPVLIKETVIGREAKEGAFKKHGEYEY
jgi:hypothetical protein